MTKKTDHVTKKADHVTKKGDHVTRHRHYLEDAVPSLQLACSGCHTIRSNLPTTARTHQLLTQINTAQQNTASQYSQTYTSYHSPDRADSTRKATS